jgi:hypothetical protein
VSAKGGLPGKRHELLPHGSKVLNLETGFPMSFLPVVNVGFGAAQLNAPFPSD